MCAGLGLGPRSPTGPPCCLLLQHSRETTAPFPSGEMGADGLWRGWAPPAGSQAPELEQGCWEMGSSPHRWQGTLNAAQGSEPHHHVGHSSRG